MFEIAENIISSLGLSKNETKVYLGLLKLGTATAIDISRESNVHRVNVYDALKRLSKKGLVATLIKDSKKLFKAANPEQLNDLLKDKEIALSNIMPNLKAEYESSKSKQDVYVLTGIQGIIRAGMMLVQKDKTFYTLCASGQTRKIIKHRHAMFQRAMKENHIKGKMLYFECTRKDRSRSWEEPLLEIRFLPDKFLTPCLVDFSGSIVVNFIPHEDSLMAIVIDNQYMADTLRNIFEFMWQYAKP